MEGLPVGAQVAEMEVKGRNLAEGVPRSFTVNSNEILEAITEPLNAIVSTVKIALEQTPPELSADIAEAGIVLTGGGALLKDLDNENIEPQAHWNMALSYERLDNSEKAQSEFLLAYPDFKENPDFLRQMIMFFNAQNNSDITKQLLERYLKLVPEDDEMQDLYNNL